MKIPRFLLTFVAFTLFSACTTTYPNKNPTGENFPTVKGKSLAGKEWILPQDLAGEAVILLLGYKQEAQFDIDRWLIGLDAKQVKLPIFEIPVLAGIIPKMIQDRIDKGMQRGIPSELWKVVITVYEDGQKLVETTGNENPNNARVLLLDKKGQIVWFHDQGFSVKYLNGLTELAKNSKPQAPPAD